ncbi:3-hydroxyisobutyryl-CoA hydrolase, mitochondrial-like [Leguminivora glycinivorella]|uniref:3-hydroxyisobutyryl-CoA hydrolase, mitochondrial-like n=1 Tax=Leguminivora glycinivorella TaxID=1035111 RepID=UPI00200ED49B|nr:3-hydroxyisobutyryl-CoA hydrolase, mitochondrial-like [Leguminivora glycinivorella]
MKTNVQAPKILFEKLGTAGVVTFNRPKFNPVNYSVSAQLHHALASWERSCSRVLFKGAGGNFSAGGDFKWLLSSDREPTKYAYMSSESNNKYRISQNRIPYVAFMDGAVLGVALMLVAHAKYRVVTERTVVAMPEARFGWLSSGPHFLPKLDNHLGFFMSMTGKLLKSKDVMLAGMATHFVPSARLQELELELISCNVEDIETRLNSFSEPIGEFTLAPHIKDIDYCFSADTVEEIIERLSKMDCEWSKEVLEMMAPLCPTMLKVTLKVMRLGKTLDLKNALRMTYRVLSRCVGSYNAQEGLRALLAGEADHPNWQPRRLEEVTDVMVDKYFEPLPEGEELRLYDD